MMTRWRVGIFGLALLLLSALLPAQAINPILARRVLGSQNRINPVTQSSLQVYLRSDTLAGADGSNVASWADLSGNARDAANANAAQQPILRRTGSHVSPSGLPMVEFDGDDDWLADGLPAAGNVLTADGITIYAYFKQISLTNSSATDRQQLFDCGAGGGGVVLELIADGGGVGVADDLVGCNTGFAVDSFGATTLGYQVLVYEFIPPSGSTAEYKVYRNNTQIGVTETDWRVTDLRDGYSFGNVIALNSGWRGAMGALAVYNVRHTPTTREGIVNYLLATYGS